MPAAAALTASDHSITRTGSPVLLVPGWCASSRGWGSLTRNLSTRHTVITVDHRAVGGNGGIRTLADHALAVLDDAGIHAAHVVGNSFGGLIAQALAVEHPQRVRSLVLLSTSPGTPSIPPSPRLMPGGARCVARRVLHRDAASPDLRDRVDLRLAAAQMLAALSWCGVRRLPRVRARTLVIHGSRDRVVPPVNARLMVLLVPGAQLHIVEGAGHRILSDAPAEVEDAIGEFLAPRVVWEGGTLGTIPLSWAS